MMSKQIHQRYDKTICLHVCVCVCLLGHSHQPLQGPLLVHFIGAVLDVGVKVGLGVLADDVVDVIDHDALLVSFLQLLKEPEHRRKKGQPGSGTRGVALKPPHMWRKKRSPSPRRQEGQRTPFAWTLGEITVEDIPTY